LEEKIAMETEFMINMMIALKFLVYLLLTGVLIQMEMELKILKMLVRRFQDY
jgi:hypothetical protein